MVTSCLSSLTAKRSSYASVVHYFPRADCAVCSDNFALGVSNRCHKCSGDKRILAVGIATAMLALVVFVATMVVSDLLRVGADGTEKAQDEERVGWHRRLLSCHRILVKTLPLSAIRIVVVVVQIITQVCPLQVCLKQAFSSRNS